MQYRFQYNSQVERDQIITENAHLIIVEEQNITEGNFLVFAEKPIEPPPSIEEKILAENQYQTMLLELTTMGGM